MTPLKVSSGQLFMAGGMRQGWAPNARAVEPTGSDKTEQRKGSLYMLVELQEVPPSPQILYRQILNVVQRTYYEAPTSTTASLQSALLEAHALMQEAKVTGGISCVVLRDGDLYVAQVAPALVVLAGPSVVQLFPVSPQSDELPLGGRARPEISMFYDQVQTPTTVLLADSRWLDRVDPKMMAGATTAPSISAILHVLSKLAGREELAALAIGLGVPAEDAEGLPEVDTEAWAEAVAEKPAGEEGREAAVDRKRRRRERKEPQAALAGAARAAGERLEQAGAQVAEGVKALGEQMLPEREHEVAVEPLRPRAQPKARPKRRASRWPLALAIAIPLIVAITVGALWWRRSYMTQQQYTNLMEAARVGLQAATGITDEEQARPHIQQAMVRVEEALSLKQGDPAALRLKQEIQAVLDQVNRVVPLPLLMPLYEFSAADRDLARVIVHGDDVFVLDRGTDAVTQLQLDPALRDVAEPVSDQPLVRKGQQVGQGVVSELSDITWLTPGGAQSQTGLLVLDQSGGLYLYDATGLWEPMYLPLRVPAEWRYPQSAQTYAGNFYVLEPSLNQIFRYLPTGNGYSDDATAYFDAGSPVSLGGVVDMAISSEGCGGYVYLLYRNGVLTKYARGVAEPFAAIVPDKQPQDTPAFFSSAENCHVFVVDAGNGRIVEFQPDGVFLFQYRLAEGEALQQVRSLFVDDTDDSFFLLTNDALYRVPIPR